MGITLTWKPSPLDKRHTTAALAAMGAWHPNFSTKQSQAAVRGWPDPWPKLGNLKLLNSKSIPQPGRRTKPHSHCANAWTLGVIRWQRHWLLPKFCRMLSSAVQIFSDSVKGRTVICGRQRLKGVDSKSRAAMPRKARFQSQRRSRLLAKFGDSFYIFPGFSTGFSGTLPTDNRTF